MVAMAVTSAAAAVVAGGGEGGAGSVKKGGRAGKDGEACLVMRALRRPQHEVQTFPPRLRRDARSSSLAPCFGSCLTLEAPRRIAYDQIELP